jgi:uncharacterized protein RhaS with RHS repeats
MVILLALLAVLCGHEAQAFYNASTGRWLNRDPISESGGKNVYAIAQNAAVTKIDPLGLAPINGYTLQVNPSDEGDASHFAFHSLAIILPITYPANGVKCACRGRFLGAAVGSAWLDLSTAVGLKDAQPEYYNSVIAPWPRWDPQKKAIFENPRYVGAGFSLTWKQTSAGSLCCKKPVWYNYLVRRSWHDKDDGRFPGLQYLDSPGQLKPPARSMSRGYKLVLACEDAGWPKEIIGQWAWGVELSFQPYLWSATLFPPTRNFVEPWPF